ADTTSDWPAVTASEAQEVPCGGDKGWAPTPPVGRSGTASSGNTSSRESEESAATNFPSENFTGGRACAPSSTFMKAFPCRVLVTRSPSLQTKPRPAELLTRSGCAGAPEAIQTMSSEEELTRVLTVAPSPRPEGMAAASTVKVLPEAASTITGSVVLHSSVCSSASPSLKVSVERSTPWPLRARSQPFCDR